MIHLFWLLSCPLPGLTILWAPLHNSRLSCDLVDGDVFVEVRPALPINRADVILGSDLAGNRVWADGSKFPEVFTACVVTCAMSRDQSDSTVQFSSVLFFR